MIITRRNFLKYCISTAATIGLSSSVLFKLKEAYSSESDLPKIIWIDGSGCSGCSVSLANNFGNCMDYGPVDLNDLLVNYIDASYFKLFMSAAGDMAVQCIKDTAAGDFILVVEGGIPTEFNGMACTLYSDNGRDVTMMEAVSELAPKAKKILCAGTCASYGGVAAAGANAMKVKSVSEYTGLPTINLPGCPVHPDWLVKAIAMLLCGQSLTLHEEFGYPREIYKKSVHFDCPRRRLVEDCDVNANCGGYATDLGQEGQCLYKLGCRGIYSIADCSSRGWNSGHNFCIQANNACIGCVESDFPRPQLVSRPARP